MYSARLGAAGPTVLFLGSISGDTLDRFLRSAQKYLAGWGMPELQVAGCGARAIELVGDAEYVSDQIAIAAGQASSMGANVLNVVMPEPLSAAIQRRFDATVVPLERGDPWLVKSLGDSP